jgi:heptosyltransferase-2
LNEQSFPRPVNTPLQTRSTVSRAINTSLVECNNGTEHVWSARPCHIAAIAYSLAMNPGHTLVIRPGALGDAVLTLPALHALRLAGATQLVILGTPPSWGFARKRHGGLRVRDFASSDWLALFQAGGGTLAPSAQAELARVRTAIVYLREGGAVKDALHNAGVRNVACIDPPVIQTDEENPAHAARALLDPLWPLAQNSTRDDALQIIGQAGDCFLNIEMEEQVAALDKLGLDAAPEGGFFALHPGSGGRKKWWPVKHFARVATELACRQHYTPLVFFGPADGGLREAFDAAMPPGVHWEAVENRPLREVLALLSMARGFLGNDSGLTHLAARACPTVAIFGPTDPRVWGPLGGQVRIVQAPGGILDKLSVETVLEEIRFLVSGF